MTTYTVHFRTGAQRASHDIEAKTPKQALALARKLDPRHDLWFDPDYSPMPVNEIAVCDPDGEEVALWLDDELRLRLAASDLLEALINLEARIDGAYADIDLTEARAAIAKAKGGAT